MKAHVVAVGFSIAALTALSALAVDRAGAAPGLRAGPQNQRVQAPIYTVVNKGTKRVIYPIEFGRVNSSKGIVTDAAKWHPTIPTPIETRICASYNVSGNCGMKCEADGGGYNYYGISCSAEIFEYGFDIVG